MLNLERYNVNIPRYTSYPPVPQWNKNAFSKSDILNKLKSENKPIKQFSIYIHLPYCERLCSYCGCFKYITTNHKLENSYIVALLNEWNLWQVFLDINCEWKLASMHLGGGTPTFFSAENLKKLISYIVATVNCDKTEISIEIHPTYTSFKQLEFLVANGLNRLSIGIQDFSDKILKAINREQDVTKINQIFKWARHLNIQSINVDMVYGLPFQNLDSLQNSLNRLIEFNPDRIAYYGYAHVPWKSKSQRHFNLKDIPDTSLRYEMVGLIESFLTENGYEKVGLDHFAKPNDALVKAKKDKKLVRNFMGYTDYDIDALISLGASSISKINRVYVQNIKNIEQYKESIKKGDFPWDNWHYLSEQQIKVHNFIVNMLSLGEADLNLIDWNSDLKRNYINQLQQDGLAIILNNKIIKATKLGNRFLRHIAWLADENFGLVKHNVYSSSI